VRVGSLLVAFRTTGGMTSLDGSSPPCNATSVGQCPMQYSLDMHDVESPSRCGVSAVRVGSWGDVPCNMTVIPFSYRALHFTFSAPVTASGWIPTSVSRAVHVNLEGCEAVAIVVLFAVPN
jgi:hypothetical protein